MTPVSELFSDGQFDTFLSYQCSPKMNGEGWISNITDRTGPKHVGAPGRLIFWLPFKPIFFKYLFKTIFPMYSSDVLAPRVSWGPGQLPGWLAP
jgi:hypothetical protein